MLSLANPLLEIDVYKESHRGMMPPGITRVYSLWTHRMSRLGTDKATVFGLRNYLETLQMRWDLFFSHQGLAGELIQDYARVLTGATGNPVNTKRFQDLFNVGRLPLTIKSVREGTAVPVKVPSITIENTHPGFSWLPQFIETGMSNSYWKAPTAATISVNRRSKDNAALEISGGPKEIIPYLNHDFSYRGTSGLDDAIMVGLGHLVGSDGSDTVPAIARVPELYLKSTAGKSIAASEHSVMSVDGEDLEFETFKRLLALYPDRPISLVSDTWNLWRVISDYLPRLGALVTGRVAPLIIRPDSGEPVDILMGDQNASEGIVRQGVVPYLLGLYGARETSKGYSLLQPFIGTVYGDAMNDERCDDLNAEMLKQGICPSNTVRGRGSYTYAYVTRDTLGSKLSASEVVIGKEARAISKNPITSNGTKKSPNGRIALIRDEAGAVTGYKDGISELEPSGFEWTAMEDGILTDTRETFNEVRKRTGVW